jgi:hypothetical protein
MVAVQRFVAAVAAAVPAPGAAAEVYNGQLYASSDNKTQSIYQIDPVTGTTTDVYDRGLPSGSEAEGPPPTARSCTLWTCHRFTTSTLRGLKP